MREVLDILRERSEWDSRLKTGSARGMALHESFGTICGTVAEVTISGAGDLSVDRIVSAVDCGNLVNPQTARMQVESGIVYGLSAALHGKMTVENG